MFFITYLNRGRYYADSNLIRHLFWKHHYGEILFKVHPSIHPSVFFHVSEAGWQWQISKQRCTDFLVSLYSYLSQNNFWLWPGNHCIKAHHILVFVCLLAFCHWKPVNDWGWCPVLESDEVMSLDVQLMQGVHAAALVPHPTIGALWSNRLSSAGLVKLWMKHLTSLKCLTINPNKNERKVTCSGIQNKY